MPRFLDPTTPLGALAIGLLFVAAGFASTWVIRRVTDETLLRDRREHADKLAISFASHFVIFLAWIMLAGFYAHLVPVLNKLGTALLAGVSVVSIVVGFAAQTTLGNLIAGVSLVLYKPFGQGDRIQVPAPTADQFEVGVVTGISLGYTIIRTDDGREVIVANGTLAQQTMIKLPPK